MDANLPVDIKLSALGDWLSSRRYINADWANKIKNVRKKIADAIVDMPEHSRILELLSNSYINYYNCREIVEILKETEKDSKNFLGFYSSQRMKDWKEIVSLYEKDNLHIAEAAQQLNQLVKFDIPGLKRDLAAQEKKISERVDNSRSQLKQAEDLKKAYNSELSRRGLKGDNLRLEFFQKTGSLDKVCSEVEGKLKILDAARKYYTEMRAFVLGDSKKILLPILQLFFSTTGEATAYQWLHGAAPTSIERPNFKEILHKLVGSDTADEIDFGDDDINLDVDLGDADIVDFEVHDCITDIVAGDEIVLEETNNQKTVKSDRVAVGQEALSLVQNETCREVLKAELMELQVFLKSAQNDHDREHPASMLLSGYDNTPTILNISQSQINSWMKDITEILTALSNSDTNELFQIRTDPGYVQQLIDQVKEPILKSKRLEDCSKATASSVVVLRDEFQKSVSQVKQTISKTAQLEQKLCSDLTKFTKGRPINLMGAVKSVETI